MLRQPEPTHNTAINSRLWPPCPFPLLPIRFLQFVFCIFDQLFRIKAAVGVLVTRWSLGIVEPV